MIDWFDFFFYNCGCWREISIWSLSNYIIIKKKSHFSSHFLSQILKIDELGSQYFKIYSPASLFLKLPFDENQNEMKMGDGLNRINTYTIW